MSATPRTHYEILGLTKAATQDEIRVRYRELVRRYHPDVAQAPDADIRFREINEAHRVLSDPFQRATYDAEMKLRARHDGQGFSVAGHPTRGPVYAGTGGPSRRNGNGRTAEPPRPQKSSPSVQRAMEIAQHLEDARDALTLLRFREADEFCRRALLLDPRNSLVHEMLGDVHYKRGLKDEALAMYSYAVQVDRSNRSAQVKLDRMVGQRSGATMAGTAARASRSPSDPLVTQQMKQRARVIASALALGVVLYMVSVIWRISEPTAQSPLVHEWDPLLLLALGVSGLAAGFVASMNSWIARSHSAFGVSRSKNAAAQRLPVRLLLGVTSILLFHASAAVYLVVGLFRGRLSHSVLGAYLVTYFLIFLFTIAAEASGSFVVLFGGNIVFPLYLFGWDLGDRLRG